MLAARSYGKKDIRVTEVDIPQIDENELLIKVERAGICGTDVRIYKNGLNDVEPKTLGHELSGTITKVGSQVSNYKEGMRVTLNPNMGCGVCDYCTSGNFHMCRDYYALGVQIDGGFAEYVKVPERFIKNGNIIEIPENVSFESASIVEPLSCVYNGITHTKIAPGDTTLIIGAGPIGLMFAKLAELFGSSTVILSNRSIERLQLAKEINPDWITVQSDQLDEKINEVTKGKGVDVCIVAASSPSAQKQALKAVGVFGRINFFGGLPKGSEEIAINSNDFHYKQIMLTGTTKSNNIHFRKSMEFVEKGIVNVEELISADYPLQNFNQAMEHAVNSKGLKTMITF